MWNELNKEVTSMCKAILPNNDLNNDLKQEVLLALFNTKNIESLFKEDKRRVFGLALRIAYRHCKERNQYFNKYVLQPFKNTIEFESFLTPAEEPKEITLNEMTEGLNEIDRLWIETYVSSDCATSQVSQKTGIYRKSIDYRLNKIFNKIRYNVLEK